MSREYVHAIMIISFILCWKRRVTPQPLTIRAWSNVLLKLNTKYPQACKHPFRSIVKAVSVNLNFWVDLYEPRHEKTCLRDCGCAGWSAPSLFAHGINMFSHDVTHMQYHQITSPDKPAVFSVSQILILLLDVLILFLNIFQTCCPKQAVQNYHLLWPCRFQRKNPSVETNLVSNWRDSCIVHGFDASTCIFEDEAFVPNFREFMANNMKSWMRCN